MLTRAQFVLALGLLCVPGDSRAANYDGSQLAQPEKTLWTELERSAWIPQGSGRQIVYAIIDPNCPFSRELFRRTQSLIDPQRTQVRWIPVAEPPQPVEDSRRKAAAALAGGIGPLTQYMQGGYATASETPRELSLVNANLTMKADMDAVFRRAGVTVIGVPQFFYVTQKGEMRLVNGDPSMLELTNVYRGNPSPP
jgi:thiol:disulfide interchange protein DsbG